MLGMGFPGLLWKGLELFILLILCWTWCRRLKDFQTLAVHVQEAFMKQSEENVAQKNREMDPKGKENRTVLAQMYP